jgi:hypothetical protein
MPIAADTAGTSAASLHWIQSHTLTDLDGCDLSADLNDDSSRLMAGHNRRHTLEFGIMKIRRADGCGVNLHQDLGRSELRSRNILHLEIIFACPNDGFHLVFLSPAIRSGAM